MESCQTHLGGEVCSSVVWVYLGATAQLHSIARQPYHQYCVTLHLFCGRSSSKVGSNSYRLAISFNLHSKGSSCFLWHTSCACLGREGVSCGGLQLLVTRMRAFVLVDCIQLPICCSKLGTVFTHRGMLYASINTRSGGLGERACSDFSQVSLLSLSWIA